MSRRIVVFVALAVALALVFVRLGIWQVDRLHQRRARNATIAAHLAEPVVALDQLSDSSSFRRVTVTGVPDYGNEIVLTGRSRNGSPGVYILTPIRRPGSDTAVIVIRGWVYAPDAATADLARWRELRTTFAGYIATLPPTEAAPASNGRKLRMLTLAGVRALLPYPAGTRYVVSRDSQYGETPARLEMPALDDGPHLSYAIQWFAFAAIALGGAVIVAFRARTRQYTGSTGA